jgi:hypothetical protein
MMVSAHAGHNLAGALRSTRLFPGAGGER